MTHSQTSSRQSRPLARGCVALATLLGASGLCAQATTTTALDATKTTIEKWVETRRIISKEQRDWQLGRELLQQRIAVVTREIEELRGRIADAKATASATAEKEATARAERDRLQEATAGLAAVVEGLEQRTRDLLARVPDPVRERVAALSQRLPAAGTVTKASLGDRFQNVIVILNEVNKMAGELSVVTEVRTLPGGTSTEVTTLYVGLGQGYYVNAKGDAAGIGVAGPDGWVWTAANDAAPAIRDVIAIYRGEQVARFVRLPVRIQ